MLPIVYPFERLEHISNKQEAHVAGDRVAMANRQRVTRVLILSDTHSALPNSSGTPEQPFSTPLPQADVAIHAGDLTSTGKLHEHRRALTLLKSLPAPLKIVIPGNHDLSLDGEYCSKHPWLYAWDHGHTREELNEASDLYTNHEAVDAGIVYLVEGTRQFQLANGALLNVYASAYTPEFCDWGFAYHRDEDRFNATDRSSPANPVPDFDKDILSATTIIITHGPPRGLHDQTATGAVGCDHLAKAVERCKPLLHCYGHIHEAWGQTRVKWTAGSKPAMEPKIQTQNNLAPLTRKQMQNIGYVDATEAQHGEETIFINASIMNLLYQPTQKPWIVDLMLPAAT